ncbi:uncharacterized protein LOC142328787 isoform X2 [Lycorma delicatula]
MSPIENCELLLSIVGFDNALHDPVKSSSSWIKLATVLLPLIEKSEQFKITFNHLIQLILNNKAVIGRDKFLHNIWEKAGSSQIPISISLIEEIMMKEPKYIELKIINIFSEAVNKGIFNVEEIRAMWETDNNYLLILWSAKSVVIFAIISSIMNEIMLSFSNSKVFNIFLELIKVFVFCLNKKCQNEKKKLSDLYPWQYRHLVNLLNYEPAINTENEKEKQFNKKIVDIIQLGLENKPETIIGLICHSLAWNDTF